MLYNNGKGKRVRSRSRMTFEPSKNYVGLEQAVEEVDYEVIPRKKCKQCKCYLSERTVSILCMKCSAKQIVSKNLF